MAAAPPGEEGGRDPEGAGEGLARRRGEAGGEDGAAAGRRAEERRVLRRAEPGRGGRQRRGEGRALAAGPGYAAAAASCGEASSAGLSAPLRRPGLPIFPSVPAAQLSRVRCVCGGRGGWAGARPPGPGTV